MFGRVRIREPAMKIDDFVQRIKQAHLIGRNFPSEQPIHGKGLTEDRIAEWEGKYNQKLPASYREALKKYNFIILRDGIMLFGLDSPYESPWYSRKHAERQNYWVIGNCFIFADGDQLLMDDDGRCFLYRHENEEKIEKLSEDFSGMLDSLSHLI